MPDDQYQDFATSMLSEFNAKLTDLEDKQRLLKERVLLVGQNLIESKENMGKDLMQLKLDSEEMKADIKKIKFAILRLSEEMENKARKSELEMLEKQAKMFQPLEFARIEDIRRMLHK